MQNHANKERENIESIGEIKAKNLEFLVCTCFYVQYRVCVDFFLPMFVSVVWLAQPS